MVASEYVRCIYFEDGLKDNLRVLIAPQRDAKIAEDVKCAEFQNRDRERGRNKRDSEPLSSVQRREKKARSDGPVKVGALAASAGLQPYGDCGRRHPGECWRRIGACLRCGSLEHCIREHPLRANQVQALTSGLVQPQRVFQQPLRGRGQVRGGNGMGRGQRASDRGAGQTEARQPTLVYTVCRREDKHATNVITGTLFIFGVPYLSLIDIGSTDSYIASSISETLEISMKSTTSEVTILSPLGQSIWVSKLYRDVPLMVQGIIFLANLMELPFGEYDLILGMDWLVEH
ncbi:pre-mrna-splicing factor slu7 [Gossypium australe]|uniref:Pre-mrna-splicing factor slu7 n=1 Tax=Gossypium australe TaxID=47621 RepID=A0A5B6WPY7_9ROSI|nr:pre-mrna-splicing factor slu7 [Gossypium australe]